MPDEYNTDDAGIVATPEALNARLDEIDATLRSMEAQEPLDEASYDALEDEWLETFLESDVARGIMVIFD